MRKSRFVAKGKIEIRLALNGIRQLTRLKAISEVRSMTSKNEVVRRIEQIDCLLTCIQDIRRAEMNELEKIEAAEGI